MASLNKVILIGRLGKDPEITTFADGRRNYAKGDLMYVEGKLRTRQYTDQQGIVRYVTEVLADKMMQMAPARPAQQSSYGQPYAPAPEPTPGYMPPTTAPDGGNDLPF